MRAGTADQGVELRVTENCHKGPEKRRDGLFTLMFRRPVFIRDRVKAHLTVAV
jgi:hypothetical protein